MEIKSRLTDGILDENHLVGLDERSHANDVLGGDPEEVAFVVEEALNHGVVSGHRVGHRRPAHSVRLPLLDDVVGDGRATVVFRRVPGELAGVVGQILAGEGKADWTRDVWRNINQRLVRYLTSD